MYQVCLRPSETTGEFLGVSGKPDYVRRACEKSLQRLGVETIDLYYPHRVDKETPIEETVKAMAELIKKGEVRYLGLSECSAETLHRAHKVHPITGIQMVYSPWTRTIETYRVLETARKHGVCIVCFSPLGRAMFTSTGSKPAEPLEPDDARRFTSRFEPDDFRQNQQLVDKMKALANKKGGSLSEFVLAWIFAQGPEFIVTPGTKRLTYLEQNVNAGQVTLTPDEVAEMKDLLNDSKTFGARPYDEEVSLLDDGPLNSVMPI